MKYVLNKSFTFTLNQSEEECCGKFGGPTQLQCTLSLEVAGLDGQGFVADTFVLNEVFAGPQSLPYPVACSCEALAEYAVWHILNNTTYGPRITKILLVVGTKSGDSNAGLEWVSAIDRAWKPTNDLTNLLIHNVLNSKKRVLRSPNLQKKKKKVKRKVGS